MSNTYTAFCKGELAKDFTGVLYSDTGRLNYAAAVSGKILVNKRNMNRWFKSEMEASRAIIDALQQQVTLFAAEFERTQGYKPAPFQKAIAMQRLERGQSIREIIDALVAQRVNA